MRQREWVKLFSTRRPVKQWCRSWRSAAGLGMSVLFFGHTGKSDFVTPDFLGHRCLPPGSDVRAADAVVGEVLSPSNTPGDVEAKKGAVFERRHSSVPVGRTAAGPHRYRGAARVFPYARAVPRTCLHHRSRSAPA